MEIKRGVMKMVHAFRYSEDADTDTKLAVIRRELEDIRDKGYDGIVTNCDFSGGYLDGELNRVLLREKLKVARELGLRVWIYDEKGYPSGAAGAATLRADPLLEAKALAAVYRVLEPGESAAIALPHGHIAPAGGFAFRFTGDGVTEEDLIRGPLRAEFSDGAYRFENDSSSRLLCLGFFVKPAFEGTHCQHNAASVRRYIDIADPRSAKAFIENTYAPYVDLVKDFIESGTVEAFFADEPSFMGVYFNLKKTPRTVTHFPDDSVELWAMVNWSDALCDSFSAEYGYRIEEELPYLFMGESENAKRVRTDYYRLLSRLARDNFFTPLSRFCREHGLISSGHILLEERIRDHPYYEGNFFELLSSSPVPGMDMLDSVPERIWKKAFTPLLISSVSRLTSGQAVMDEISAHFQHKFGVPYTARQLFCSVMAQFCFGADIFHSYYDELSDPILEPTPAGSTVLKTLSDAVKRFRRSGEPSVYIHYPIESVFAHTVSPVDVGRVYDSALNEYRVAYPIDRAKLDGPASEPFIARGGFDEVIRTERSMEDCMFALLDRQILPGFCDTARIKGLKKRAPGVFVIPREDISDELSDAVSELAGAGWRVISLSGNRLIPKAVSVPSAADIIPLVREYSPCAVSAPKVAAAGYPGGILLVNCSGADAKITLKEKIASATELYTGKAVPVSDGGSFTLEPDAVIAAEYLRG